MAIRAIYLYEKKDGRNEYTVTQAQAERLVFRTEPTERGLGSEQKPSLAYTQHHRKLIHAPAFARALSSVPGARRCQVSGDGRFVYHLSVAEPFGTHIGKRQEMAGRWMMK